MSVQKDSFAGGLTFAVTWWNWVLRIGKKS
jgi:hypothetical protein